MHRCQNSRANGVCTQFFLKLLIESVKIALEKAWKAQTHWKDEKHTRDHLQACNRKGERSKWPIVRPDPPKNGARQGCPLRPLLSLFISDIPKLLKEGGYIHWSNTWHISNQLPTVCYQTIVVNLAYRLMTKVMVFSNSVSRQDIQPLILNNKHFETVKEYTRTWELYLCKIESLQGPKEHWQCKQRKSYTLYERHC